jgi:hypothetical protein
MTPTTTIIIPAMGPAASTSTAVEADAAITAAGTVTAAGADLGTAPVVVGPVVAAPQVTVLAAAPGGLDLAAAEVVPAVLVVLV